MSSQRGCFTKQQLLSLPLCLAFDRVNASLYYVDFGADAGRLRKVSLPTANRWFLSGASRGRAYVDRRESVRAERPRPVPRTSPWNRDRETTEIKGERPLSPSPAQVNLSCDFIFMADIVKNLNMGYVDEQGVIVMDRSRALANYAKTWFVIDTVSSVPVSEILELAGGGGDNPMLSSYSRVDLCAKSHDNQSNLIISSETTGRHGLQTNMPRFQKH